MIRITTQFICRRALWVLLAVTALPLVGLAGTKPLSTTNLFGYFTSSNNLPIIDANVWINDATFDNILTTYPYDTTSTVIFSNNAGMSGQVGFRFDTVDEVKGQRRPQSIFYNHGTIAGLDSPLQFFNPFFGSGGFLGFGPTTTPASYLLVSATNIINSGGTLQVGNVGLMRLSGKNVDLSNGTLVAGDISDNNTNLLVSSGFFFNVIGSTTGRGIMDYLGNAYVNPPQVFDLYWGSTPSGSQPLAPLSAQPPGSPSYVPDFVQTRGQLGLVGFDLPITLAEFDAYEFGYVFNNQNTFTTVDQGGGSFTNYYFNFIFVKTNVSDPSITINARFGFSTDFVGIGTNVVDQGSEAMVQFGTVTNDITTGLPVTNAFYLLDSGFFQSSIDTMTNQSDPNKVGKPSNLQVTTATPFEWAVSDTNFGLFGFFGLSQFYLPFNPDDLFPGQFGQQGLYPTKPVSYSSGSWGVQVGRQPEVLSGLTISSNSFADFFTNLLVLPDPSNDAPRIEITATNLNLSSTYIRSEGFVSINTKHLIPGAPAGIDVGELNGDFGSTNGLLQISKVISPTFKRVRGDVFAWSGNFNFTATNDVSTNNVHIHVLVVDHELSATFTPTFHDLALRSPITQVSDNLRVINSSLFQAQQLSFDSQITLAQNAANLTAKNLPNLTDFLIDTNGVLSVEGVAMIGWDRPHGINTFTNNGLFIAVAPLVRANVVQNTGEIEALGGSSMVLIGDTVNLIPGTPGTNTFVLTNALISSRNLTVSAGDLTVYGSTMIAGSGGGPGSLIFTPTSSFTDLVPNIPGTNNVITNSWTASDGIRVTQDPFRGDVENDLYGTEIVLTATNRTQAVVSWPAQDVGAEADGFQNNLVVGHLVLDRQTSTSSFRFSAAGGQNAIYVDYLELRDFSFSDYRNGLFVDPNMTIYFAASNFEPQKLMALYPGRIVWAQDVLGPNSTKAVARKDGTICFMNISEANSQIIDSDGDGTPNGSDQFPLDNDKTGEVIPCPGGEASGSIHTLFTASQGKAVTTLSISTIGNGKVTPQPRSGLVDLGSAYTFSAVPKAGNLFAGWSGDVNTTQPKITLTLLSNTMLTARFVPNPFLGLKGSYNGLFYDTNGVNIDSAGAIALAINQQGGFSGRLTMAGGAFLFGGQFDPDGNATTTVRRAKKTPLGLTLKLDTTGAQQITGTLSDSNWTAAIIADRAVFGGRSIAPFAGNYTFTWSGSDSDPVNNPGGDSYGSALINRAGQLIATIRLADNNTVQQVVPVSKDGNWPLFGSLPGKGMIIGWVHIDNSSVLSGTLDWIKMPVKAGLYKNGFSNMVSLVGSAWVAPKTRGATGLNLTNPVITLANGDLGAAVVPAITFNPNNLTFSSSTPSLSLKLTPRVGVISGRFVDPATSRIRQFGGVMLQSQNEARGFFLGTDQSGAVRLDNP